MEKSRLQAYMNLIRELLLCPSGEEWEILRANGELVDAQLIELMEQVAIRAEEKGAEGTVAFLRDLGKRLSATINQNNQDEDSESPSDYLRLVETLLHCESGLEPEILREHKDLIDTRLVVTLRQVAGILAEIGEGNASVYLHSIADPLAEALENASSDAIAPVYLDLLGELLRVTANTQGDKKAIYDILKQNLAYLDMGFVQALDDWATATIFSSKPHIAYLIAEDIVNFSLLVLDFPEGDRECNVEIAIAGFESALRAFRRDRNPEKWAEVQVHIGDAYQQRLLGERGINLEVAIECYRASLEIYEADTYPQECAQIHSLLSNVYEHRIHGDKTDNLQIALAYLRSAWEILTLLHTVASKNTGDRIQE